MPSTSFAKEDVVAALRNWKELRFDESSRLYAPFAGVSSAIADTLDTFLRPDERLRYGIATGALELVPNSELYRGLIAWWLLSDRALLTVEVSMVGAPAEIATRRYAVNPIRRIHLTEVISPPDGGSPRFYALELQLPDTTLHIESSKLDQKTMRSGAIKRFAGELASIMGESV